MRIRTQQYCVYDVFNISAGCIASEVQSSRVGFDVANSTTEREREREMEPESMNALQNVHMGKPFLNAEIDYESNTMRQ